MDPQAGLSPLPPPQSIPASPSLGARKRSIHEVDGAGMLPPSPKRSFTGNPGENQENCDPSVPPLNKDNASPPSKQMVSVEIPSPKCTQGSWSGGVQSSTVDMSSIPPHPQPLGAGSPVHNDTAGTPAAKKRKLSPASQQAKQQEKEVKERERLEEKQRKEEERRLKEEEKKKREAAREEEKRLKEEERKKREAEREEKRKAKEEEKAAREAAKEEEKRRKEEEKLKKERAQPKLNSFFAKPRLPSSSTAGSSSPGKTTTNPDASTEPSQSTQSDYEKAFPEFFLQSHTTVAPLHRFERDSEALRHVRQNIDSFLPPNHDATYQHLPFRPSEVFHMIPFTRRRGRRTKSVKEILQNVQAAADAPTQLLETNSSENPLKQLRNITMKSLKFGEDVRPPYQGTFTRAVPEESAKKLCRNPYYRGLPDVNYDYDSEAEWEEPEEGEDLDSEEEEESDDGEDDMDGFLDDEDDALAGGKRRLIVGDLEPVCSGIQWASEGVDAEMQTYQIQTISDAVRFPIDPFSAVYWQKPRTEPASAKGRTMPPTFSNQTLESFRVNPGSDAPAVGSALPSAATKARRPFPPELLPEFKQAVEGSDLSKIGLVEILKKKFPKVSKDTLKITLDEVAMRVGQKEVEKKWVCR